MMLHDKRNSGIVRRDKTGGRTIRKILIVIIVLFWIPLTPFAGENSPNRWKTLSIQLEVRALRLAKLGKYLNRKRDAKGRISATDLISIRRLMEEYMGPANELYQLLTNKKYTRKLKQNNELVAAKLFLINKHHQIIELFTDDSTIRRTLRDQSSLVTHSPTTLYNRIYSERFQEGLPSHKIPWRVATFTLKDLILWPLQKWMIIGAYALGKLSGSLDLFDGNLLDDSVVKELIAERLYPLDIMLEKKASSITDFTIPGHWGHNAIWLGSKQQLVELGIWDAPELDTFRQQIENGNSIYEVRRWGLQFDNLNDWMNLDSIAILRIDHLLEERQRILDIYGRLAAMIDAEYDYLFDYYLPSKISCGELLFHAFQDVAWPTERTMGLGVITPTLIGELPLYQNSPVSLVAFASDLDEHSGGELLTFNDYAKAMSYRPHPDYPEILAKHTLHCVLRDLGGSDGALEQECEDRYQLMDYLELEKSYQ